MTKLKKNPYTIAKKVTLKHSLHHHKAVKKIGKGVCLGILVPIAIYYGLSHRKN